MRSNTHTQKGKTFLTTLLGMGTILCMCLAYSLFSIAKPPSGYQAFWSFSGNAVDEGLSAIALDVQGPVLTQDRFDTSQSAYLFDGADDYMTVDNSLLSFTGNLTVSVWLKNTDVAFSDGTRNYVLLKGESTMIPFNDYFMDLNTEKTVEFGITNTDGDIFTVSYGPLEPNRFYNVIGVYDKDAGQLNLYVNGQLKNSIAAQGQINVTDDILNIGTSVPGNTDHQWHGVIDDIAIYGTALYPEDAQQIFYDGNWGSTRLYIRSDETVPGSVFTDKGINAHTIGVVGNPVHDQSIKLSGNSSIHFDGDDRLEIDDDADFNWLPEDVSDNFDPFTIDFWIYPTQMDQTKHVIGQWGSDLADQSWLLEYDTSGQIRFRYMAYGMEEVLTGTTSLVTNKWQHIAVVLYLNREGEGYYPNLKLFLDGKQIGSEYCETDITDSSAKLTIGSTLASNPENFFVGYLDDIRISKGKELWTSEFTPPGPVQSDKFLNCRIEKNTVFGEHTPEQLDNFPVLIHLTSSSGITGFNSAPLFDELKTADDRFKLTVVTNTGDPCYVEIEKWDPQHKEAVLWAKLPVISATTDTEFKILFDSQLPANTDYVGDTGDPAAQNVWDDNYLGVWHLGQDPSVTQTLLDSTAYQYNGLIGGSMSAANLVNGAAGWGLYFDGIDDNIQIANFSDLTTFTLEACMAPQAYGSHWYDHPVVTRWDFTDQRSFGLFWSDGACKLVLSTDGTDTTQTLLTSSVWDQLNTYVNLSGIYNGSQMTTYYNGQNNATVYLTGTPFQSTASLKIGDFDSSSGQTPFQGTIDEIRISSTPRSEVWLSATSLSNLDQLISYASDQDKPPPPEIENLTVDGQFDCKTVHLDWSGYNATGHGVAGFRIYASASEITDLSGLSQKANVDASTFEYTLDLSAENPDCGQTYYFAVVAVDANGNAITMMTSSVAAVLRDNIPPEDVTNLRVDSFADSLTFQWDHSVNTAGDLAGYKVYFNGSPSPDLVPASQNSYQATGLAAATSYPIKVTAYDSNGNESPGVTFAGTTLLNNPVNVSATSDYGAVTLTWDPVLPAELVKEYRIYKSKTPFSDVSGMEYLVSTTPSKWVSMLESNTMYYFAITAVNISNGEKKEVATVTATPLTVTYVSGVITQNATWTKTGSPYVVTGDVTVRTSALNDISRTATLTIEPGVEVRFAQNTTLFIGYRNYYRYYGALSAQGTETSKIKFTAYSDNPTPGFWNGIYFRDDTNDSLSIRNYSA